MTDNRQKRDFIDNLNVGIGLDHDWWNSPSNIEKNMTNDPKKWIQYDVNECDKVKNKEVTNKEDLNIPNKCNSSGYKLEDWSNEHQRIVIGAVKTVINVLNNDKDYKPFRATVMGGGGTGKLFIINTIITIIRDLKNYNNSVQIATPSGAAAYNVQGSTIYRLLKIDVKSPWTNLLGRGKDMRVQLERLLVLVMDKMSQINSSLLAGAENRKKYKAVYLQWQ